MPAVADALYCTNKYSVEGQYHSVQAVHNNSLVFAYVLERLSEASVHGPIEPMIEAFFTCWWPSASTHTTRNGKRLQGRTFALH